MYRFLSSDNLELMQYELYSTEHCVNLSKALDQRFHLILALEICSKVTDFYSSLHCFSLQTGKKSLPPHTENFHHSERKVVCIESCEQGVDAQRRCLVALVKNLYAMFSQLPDRYHCHAGCFLSLRAGILKHI